MIPAHHTESKMSPATQGVLPSGDYKEIRSIRVGSSSGVRELFTRALLKGNSRQTALVRTLSRVATSIRMTAVRRATSVSNTASVPPLLGYLENVVDTSWMIADDILTGKIALLCNYIAAGFPAAEDSHALTVPGETAHSTSPQLTLTTPHTK
jgi:hypothetical protein